MTVEIKNAAPCSNVRAVSFIDVPEMDLLVLRLKNANGETTTSLDLPVPALLGALRATLGVLIVDKADQPGARLSKLSTGAVEARGFARSLNADATEVRADGYALLAIADFIDGHVPPVDEVQVAALAALMRDTENVRNDVEKQARRLIATGRVEVQA